MPDHDSDWVDAFIRMCLGPTAQDGDGPPAGDVDRWELVWTPPALPLVSEWVESRGRTVVEAAEAALRQLGAGPADVEVEVLTPKRPLVGGAVVRARIHVFGDETRAFPVPTYRLSLAGGKTTGRR